MRQKKGTTAQPDGLADAPSHHGELKRFLRKYLRRREDIDDLTQDVFVELLRIKDGREIRNPLAFLKGIAINVAKRYFRARHKQVIEHDDIERKLAEAIADLPDPGDQLNAQQQLERAFLQLPPMQAAVLLLRMRDGLEYADIAAKLGLSVSMVLKHATHGRARLKAIHWEL